VQVFPVPERIASIQTTVTDSAIVLSWPAPTLTSVGEPLGGISEYHIYRGEIDPSSAEAAAKDLSQAKWKAPLVLIGRSETTSYRDTAFEFGKTYVYTVRSVIPAGGNQLASADSALAIVTPQDTFPPAPPQGLVVTAVTPPGAPPEVDLSWSTNTETDLAGYRVYRSEQQDTKGHIVTSDLLLAPAYRDTSVLPGHRYWYSVTAVDRAGNESVPSTAIMVEVEQPPSSFPGRWERISGTY
jgi:fibronectin type 3 domain-containing protein